MRALLQRTQEEKQVQQQRLTEINCGCVHQHSPLHEHLRSVVPVKLFPRLHENFSATDDIPLAVVHGSLSLLQLPFELVTLILSMLDGRSLCRVRMDMPM